MNGWNENNSIYLYSVPYSKKTRKKKKDTKLQSYKFTPLVITIWGLTKTGELEVNIELLLILTWVLNYHVYHDLIDE